MSLSHKPVTPFSVTKAGDNVYLQLDITTHTTDTVVVCCGIEAAECRIYPSHWQTTKLVWAWEVSKMHAVWASVYRELFILLLNYVFSTFFTSSLHFLKNKTKNKTQVQLWGKSKPQQLQGSAGGLPGCTRKENCRGHIAIFWKKWESARTEAGKAGANPKERIQG